MKRHGVKEKFWRNWDVFDDRVFCQKKSNRRGMIKMNYKSSKESKKANEGIVVNVDELWLLKIEHLFQSTS